MRSTYIYIFFNASLVFSSIVHIFWFSDMWESLRISLGGYIYKGSTPWNIPKQMNWDPLFSLTLTTVKYWDITALLLWCAHAPYITVWWLLSHSGIKQVFSNSNFLYCWKLLSFWVSPKETWFRPAVHLLSTMTKHMNWTAVILARL